MPDLCPPLIFIQNDYQEQLSDAIFIFYWKETNRQDIKDSKEDHESMNQMKVLREIESEAS